MSPRDPEAAEALCAWGRFLDSCGDEGAELGGPRDFRGADLSDLELKWQWLWYSDCTEVSFDRADLFKAELVGSVLDRASFAEARLHRTALDECEGRDASFVGATLLRAYLWRAELPGADLRRTWLGQARMCEADLTGADLRGAGLGREGARVDLRGARLVDCRVEGARGLVRGPVHVDRSGEPIDGEALAAWFALNGAPEVAVDAQ